MTQYTVHVSTSLLTVLLFAPVSLAQTERISVASDGTEARGGRWGSRAAISADGLVVAFDSPIPGHVPEDTDHRRDVFVRANGLTRRVGPSGTPLDGESRWPSVSADGRYVAFQSKAKAFNPADALNLEDVFVWDRAADTFELISKPVSGTQANGSSTTPSISSDGRYVAFVSNATNLIAGGPTAFELHVYRYDRQTATMSLVTRSSAGMPVPLTTFGDFGPAVASTGEVAFLSCSDALVPGDTNQACDAFVHDPTALTTARVSTTMEGNQLPYGARLDAISISDNGRMVAFAIEADAGGWALSTVAVKDRVAGTLRLAPGSQGQLPFWSMDGRLSANGRFLAYRSTVSLTPTVASNVVLRLDLSLPEAVLPVAVVAPSLEHPTTSVLPSDVTNAGDVLVVSDRDDLAPGDDNAGTDIVLVSADLQVSRLTFSTAAAGLSAAPAVSYDGSVVAFISSATSLDPLRGRPQDRLYIRDRTAATTTSVRVPGPYHDGLSSRSVSIDHSGRWVAFVQGPAWLHDRVSGSTTTITGDAPVTAAAISASGRYVVLTTFSALVPEDVNGQNDVYVYDRLTRTTRWLASLSSAVGEVRGHVSISADGRIVTVLGTKPNPQPGEDPGQEFVVHDRDANGNGVFDEPGQTVTQLGPFELYRRALGGTVSADGRFIAVRYMDTFSGNSHVQVRRLDTPGLVVLPGLLPPVNAPRHNHAADIPSIAPDGSAVAWVTSDAVTNFDINGERDVHVMWIDTTTMTMVHGRRVTDGFDGGPALGGPAGGTGNPTLSGNGRTVAFDSGFTNLVPDDTNFTFDVFLHSLVNPPPSPAEPAPGYLTWLQGLAGPPDAALLSPWSDPDDDGVTTIDEFRGRGDGQPFLGMFRRYFAEGATDTPALTFETRLALANPHPGPVDVRVDYRLPAGRTATPTALTLGPHQRITLVMNDNPELAHAEFGVAVLATMPVGVERTMVWGDGRYGGHADAGVAEAGRRWYFAEGATIAGFQLFYLLQNPSESESAIVEARYLTSKRGVVTRQYQLPPASRVNIWANAEQFGPADAAWLDDEEFSTEFSVIAGAPIVAERAMYRTLGGRMFKAGHVSAGIAAPATDWFLAEGNAGDFFDFFVLVMNATGDAADLKVDLLLSDGSVITRGLTVAGNTRQTVWIDEIEQPEGSGVYPFRTGATDLSVRVRSVNGVPIVVERAMWWPGNASTWYEAHGSAGASMTASRWIVADGEVGGEDGWETYVLVANTGAAAGTVRATLLFEGAVAPVVAGDVAVAGNSRTTLSLGQLLASAGLADGRAAVLIEATGVDLPLVVERAMYRSTAERLFEVGVNGLAMPLP
jgi:hypothetical protein